MGDEAIGEEEGVHFSGCELPFRTPPPAGAGVGLLVVLDCRDGFASVALVSAIVVVDDCGCRCKKVVENDE